MYTKFRLRTAVDSDLHLLYGVFKASVGDTCSRHYTQKQINAWIGKATPGRWKELFESDLHFILAEDTETEKIAGFTSIDTAGYLHSMFVRPEFQRQGVASLLLCAAEQFAAGHHAGSVHSEVSITARPFFERRGYVVEKEQTVVVGEVEMTNFVMRKGL